jgi:hypothetical protein
VGAPRIGWILDLPQGPGWQAPLKVGVMLVLDLHDRRRREPAARPAPALVSPWIAILVRPLLLGFIVGSSAGRLGTILELFACFVGRGHWYLIPLVVVLLSVGSLLVVAASSPLVAPFIYTLF